MSVCVCVCVFQERGGGGRESVCVTRVSTIQFVKSCKFAGLSSTINERLMLSAKLKERM